MILLKHMIAFLLTAAEALPETAKSMIVSLNAATSKPGTIVAISDNANDCAA